MSKKVPAFSGNISFNAHHSPMGAFLSFTCGHFGTRGGLAAQLGRPANQDLYIGVKDGDRYSASPLRCLPFYEGADKGAQAAVSEIAQQAAAAAANFLVEQAADPDLADPDAEKKKPKVTAYSRTQLSRHYGWGTDRWATPDFEFTIDTPFGPIPDPDSASPAELKHALLPAVTARLTCTNNGATTKTLFFAVGFHDSGVRMIDEGLGRGRLGFGVRHAIGVAAESDAGTLFPFMRWSPNDGIADRDNPVHLLGSCPGVGVEVPPGQTRTITLALGAYLDGPVTTRIEGEYLYTRCFGGLNEVLGYALDHAGELRSAAEAKDAELLAGRLSADQQFLLAHATRSYYGSTELLDVGGRPFWIVNEGEYVMINTLDLSVDQVFWELKYNPWVIANLLDNFVRFYSYHDQVKDPATGLLSPGGISFCHDQGIHNQFSPLGRSSYELTNLHGCFSHMTQEQLCNWLLIAGCYVAKTGDTEWARQQRHTLDACLTSMDARDDADGSTGIMKRDSSRCGSGQEITTYDSLDESLGQARSNLYVSVKRWASYLALALIFDKLGVKDHADHSRKRAAAAAQTVASGLRPEGFLPAVFEPGNKGFDSRILPAIEALVYPLYWGDTGAPKAYAPLYDTLRAHTVTLLGDPESRNRFPDGGLKLSSSSNNSWMSKIALFQHVSRVIFGLEKGDARQAAADSAHVKWQTEGSSAYWACSDQMVKGVAIGSKYYPRIVTTVLWLDE